jgi:hypothetical protein
MMSGTRDKMIDALNAIVVPVLRERGFRGSLPHFRRPSAGKIDLLSFQFDKWGGGFLIEISTCAESGITTYWGENIPANKVRAVDNHPDQRHRITPGKGNSTDDWFRYDQQSLIRSSKMYQQVASSVLSHLDKAEGWWKNPITPDQ